MSITRRKLAPYAKSFIQIDPDLPLAFLYFGPGAWDARKDINSRSIILPPHENPALYDWRVFKGQWVIARALGNTDAIDRRRLAFEILKAGAQMVHVFLPEQWVETSEITTDWIVPHERYFK